MKKNLSKIYTIAVVIALVVLGTWSAFDIYRLRSSNSDAAQINVDSIRTRVETSFKGGTPLFDNDFAALVRDIFKENPDLEILTIYSHDPEMGIEYHYGRGEDVETLNFSESSPLSDKDLPEYKYNQLMKEKLTSSLQAPGRAGLDMDLIYKVVDKTTIYNILIRLLIVVVVLFFTTLFMIFMVSRKSGDAEIESEDEDFKESDEPADEDLSLDWSNDGFDSDQHKSAPLSGDLSLDDDSFDEDFGELDLNSSGGDFSDLNLDDDSFGSDDLETSMDDLNFDDNSDDFSLDSDDGTGDLKLDDDFNLDSDIPEEEDLMAMDHEISPLSEDDDFSFDDISDNFDDSSDFETENSVWDDFIEEKLKNELIRSEKEDRDLVVGIIQCDGLDEDNYIDFADRLKDDLKGSEMEFEYRVEGLAIIAPYSVLDEALTAFEVFTGREQDSFGDINVGISSRNGRTIEENRLFMEAESALRKAVEDPEKNIVGFRSDPDKFREFISRKG